MARVPVKSEAAAPADSAAAQQLAEEVSAVQAESATPDLVLAAQKRQAAARIKDADERRLAEIDALLVERRGYEQRVLLVDRELGRRGFEG